MNCLRYRSNLVVLAPLLLILASGCYHAAPSSATTTSTLPEKLAQVDFSSSPKTIVLQRIMQVGQSGPEMILGQNIGCASNPTNELKLELMKLESLSPDCKRPLLIGLDYGWGDMDPEAIREANKILIDHWLRGGLVTLNFDPGNPRTLKPDPTDNSPVDLRRVILPGTPENREFSYQLRIVAQGLKELQRAGVVVLWRPFHEPNGGWFWWCAHDQATGTWTTPEHYRLLWEYTYRELTQGYRLNNLIWVYSPASMNSSEMKPTDMYYPGDDCVDLIGVDLYTDSFSLETFDAQNGFNRLRKFKKPLAICELGSRRLDGSFNAHQAFEAILEYCPDAKYVLFWHSWNEGGKRIPMALIDCLDAKQLLADSRALTLAPSTDSSSKDTGRNAEARAE
jgi:hypothetical protein